ncbi:signal recognition particle 9 kDa domain-containing protein [Trichoderma sp. SZMC 28013]
MPYFKTSQEWLDLSVALLEARPSQATDPSSADESSPSEPKPPRGSLVLKTYDPVSGVALKYRTTKAAEVTRLMYAAMGRLGRAQAGVQDVPEETMQDADATMDGFWFDMWWADVKMNADTKYTLQFACGKHKPMDIKGAKTRT